MKGNAICYTTINHHVRRAYKLTCNEYCIADFINWASYNPKNTTKWCLASQQTIADKLDLSRKMVNETIKKLCSLHLVEREKGTANVRTTALWFDAHNPETDEQVQEDSNKRLQIPVTKGYTDSNKRLQIPVTKGYTYNNSNNNTIREEAQVTSLSDLEKRKTRFYEQVATFKTNNPNKYPPDFYTKFFSYWTESNSLKAKDKMRFEKEQFFEIGRRLQTFWSNLSEQEKSNLWEKAISNGI